MRFACVRFTVRRMMVGVAVVAIGLGIRAQVARYRQLARLYEIRAQRFERSVAGWRPYVAMSYEQWLTDCRAVDEVNRKGGTTWGMMRYGPKPAVARRSVDHMRLLARKYHRAANQPWWPVGADPLPP